MGSSLSLSTSTSTSPQRKKYVDIVDDGKESSTSSFKVLIHEQLAIKAVDSLEGSKILANQISKSLVVDLLRSKESTTQFSLLLNHIFLQENVLMPTRELIYWSALSPQQFVSTLSVSKCGLQHYCVQPETTRDLSNLLSGLVGYSNFVKNIYLPFTCWILRDKAIVIDPLAGLINWSLPLAQVS